MLYKLFNGYLKIKLTSDVFFGLSWLRMNYSLCLVYYHALKPFHLLWRLKFFFFFFFPHVFTWSILHKFFLISAILYCFIPSLTIQYILEKYYSWEWFKNKPKIVTYLYNYWVLSQMFYYFCLPVQKIQKTGIWSLGREDPVEEGMATYQYSCLGNSMNRGAWWAAVHGVAESQRQ